MGGRLSLAVILGCTLASAQTQIKPRVMIVLDTSGSMTEFMTAANAVACNGSGDCDGNGQCTGSVGCTCDNGVCYIDGGSDGSFSYIDPRLTRTTAANTSLGLYPGYTTANPQVCQAPANATYLGSGTRFFNGKAAITNVVNGSGDVDWGLERYVGFDCAVQDDVTTPVNDAVVNLGIPEPPGRCTQNSDCRNGKTCDTTVHRCHCNSASVNTDCDFGGGNDFTCSATNNGVCNAIAGVNACQGFNRNNTICECQNDGDCGSGQCITTGTGGWCDCVDGANDSCTASSGMTQCVANSTRACQCKNGSAITGANTCACGSGANCSATETCTSGFCSANAIFRARAGSTCTTDDNCLDDEFCIGGLCGFNSNLCAHGDYCGTNTRDNQACGRHCNLPVSYGSGTLADIDSGCPGRQATGTTSCATPQTCTTDADCNGATVGSCVALTNSAAKACQCTTGTCDGNDYTCAAAGSFNGFCVYNNDCVNPGGQILVDPAAVGFQSIDVLPYVDNREDYTIDTTKTRTGVVASTAAGALAGEVRLTGLTGMLLTDVGKALILSNATSAGNNGAFTISNFVSATSVDVANPNAVQPDANNTHINWVMRYPKNPELRAVTNTPLSGSARTATTWYNNVIAGDPKAQCRPYVLVQITDGFDTCEPNTDRDVGPVAAAQSFVGATVAGARVLNKVYMIGLSISSPTLDAVAHVGGTGVARLATSQADIEAALADIIASSVLVEKCNYVDDDCNNQIDEAYPDVAPNPNTTTNPNYAAHACNNGAAGHCAASGVFRCASSQLAETCGPAVCRYGSGTSLTKATNTMTLSGITGFSSNFTGITGQQITIVSARNGANMGTFPITAGGAGTVSFTNAAGLAETIAGTAVSFELGCNLQSTCRLGSGSGLTKSGNSVILAGTTGITAADIGGSITITTAVNAANKGTFPITAVVGANVTYTNTAGVTEAGAPGYSIGCRDPMCRRASGASFAGKAGNSINLTGGSGFVAGDVGATITIRAAANPVNVGNFVINAVNVGTQVVTITNANGANEAGGNVQWNLYCANAESVGGCNNFDDDCNGIPDDCTEGVAGSCCSTGGCQPVEVCNGIDDDCNGQIDDNPVDVGVPCNSDVGDCSAGTLKCCNPTSGKCIGDAGFVPAVPPNPDVPTCVGGNPGYPIVTGDICDGTDDNCDGVANGVPPQLCYNDPTSSPAPFNSALAGHGLCRAGSQDCTTVSIPYNIANCPPGWPSPKPCPNPVHTFTACSGALGPHAELCDGFDNDCNDAIDNSPTDSWVGTACCPTGNPADCSNTGGSMRCAAGSFQCCTSGGSCSNQGGFVGNSTDHQTCVGAIAKSPEVCDGADNDCDGNVDDVQNLGAICNANGVLNAGPCSAHFVCVATSACTVNTCPKGGACNTSSECAAFQACTDQITGSLKCEPMCDAGLCPFGLTCQQMGTPTPELCNNVDDDCNGVVDDNVAANDTRFQMDSNMDGTPDCTAMAPYSTCVPGAPECLGGMFECVGTLPSPNPNGCGQTDECGNTINECPPGSTCYMGNCDTPCGDGEFPCPGGFICDRSIDPALCIPDDCAKLNCPTGQNCQLDMTTGKFACVDPCAGRDCGSGKRCLGGSCVDDTCRSFGCPDGEICIGNPGMCETDPCFNLECDTSQYCSNGSCVPLCSECMKGDRCVDGLCEADPCSGIKCNAGQVCMVAGGMGSCVVNACAGTTCGIDETCCGGSCINDPCQLVKCPAGIVCTIDDSCGASCTQPGAPDKDQIVGAGGGGFSCNVGGPSSSGGALWLLLFSVFFFWKRMAGPGQKRRPLRVRR